MISIFIKLLAAGVFVYVLFVFGLFTMQRAMIYFPDTTRPAPVDGAEIVKVVAQDEQELEAWYFPATDARKPVIVLFHGNSGHYGDRLFKALKYTDAGYGVVLAEYRGFGGNSGKMSEEGFYSDGRAYIDWLINTKNIEAGNIVLYGESLGSGIAVQMATEYGVAGLVLEVPFSSLEDVAVKEYSYAPVRALLKDRFMNVEKIANISAPLIILHGHKDAVIPFDYAKKLFDEAVEPKKIIQFPQGAHNDLYDFGASLHVLNFLAGIKGNIR